MYSSTTTHWTGHFLYKGYLGGVFLSLLCFVEISALNANSVATDQTPRSMVSDLDLHCLPVSIVWDAKHKLVKFGMVTCIL